MDEDLLTVVQAVLVQKSMNLKRAEEAEGKVKDLESKIKVLEQQVEHWKEKTYEYADYAELDLDEDGELVY